VTVNIMKRVLEEMGYNVELVQADYIAQFAGLESGDLHVAMEMWETTGKQAMEASLWPPATPSTWARPGWMPRKSGGIRST
jgi:ABC-type proline/glycine betaine transport system substrate-binding protein